MVTIGDYARNLGIYLAVESGFIWVSSCFYPEIGNLEINISELFGVGKQEKYGGNYGEKYGEKYRINPVKIVSPIIFCLVFRLPIWMGMGLGIIGNHITANKFPKIK